MPSEEPELTSEPPSEINPYEVLEIEEKATADQIKSAYRKQALRHHPDKALPDRKSDAHKKFQEVAFAYAILSDERRRRRYDLTGNTSESLDLEDDDFDWVHYYREQFSSAINHNVLENLKNEYKGSEEEKQDILKAFEKHVGNLDRIYASVMMSNVLDDDDRFRAIIDQAIAEGEAESWPKYIKEPEMYRKSRLERAKREAKEAEQLAKELDIEVKVYGKESGDNPKKKKKSNKPKDDADLVAMIRGKQARSSNFVDRLEEKYATEEGKTTKGKRKRPTKDDEPPEEAFEGVGARRQKPKQPKQRKIPEDTTAIADEEAPRKRRSKRTKA